MGSALRGNCCENCRNIPQKKSPMNGFTKKNYFTSYAFSERCVVGLYTQKRPINTDVYNE